MKPAHVIILLLAGALGGAVIMKVVRPGNTEIPIAEVAAAQSKVVLPASEPAAPAASIPPAPTTLEPAPVAVEEPAKPSPMPPPVTRAISKPQRTHSPASLVAVATPVAAPKPQPPAPQTPVDAPAPPPPPPGPTIPPTPVNAEPLQVSAPVPQPHQVTLNAGLILPVRLVDGISSERNVPGDLFAATLDKELVVEGWVIAERGARVEGRVVAVDRARAGRAAVALELTNLRTSDGQAVPIQTDSYFKHADPPQIDNTTKIAGGALLGAAIGAIAGGGKGAAIGAGIGGGAGAGDVLLTRHPAELPPEMMVTFRLKNSVPLTEQLR